MKKAIFLVLMLPMLVSSQYFNVFDLDTNDYPIMKAKFYSIDTDGNQLVNYIPTDIVITENFEPRNVISISCPSSQTKSLSVGIMVDTYRFINLARLGSEKLVNTLDMSKSEVGVTFMDRRPLVYQDFTTDKNLALQKVRTIPEAPGGTRVQEMFFDEYFGGITVIKNRQPENKILIFISDLHCPNLNVDELKLIQEAKDNNIKIYTVLIRARDYTGLFGRIAEQTNGMLYQNVKGANIDFIFSDILNREQNFPCEVAWESKPSCDKEITVNYKESVYNLETSSSYSLDDSRLSNLESDENFINFGPVIPGNSKDVQVVLTAVNSDIFVDSISIAPNLNNLSFLETYPIEIKSGESKVINIRFTPADSSKFYSKLTLHNNLCNKTIGVLGGFSKNKINYPSLVVTHPNNGEIFSAGIDTTISWKGVAKEDLVKIDFSPDAGTNWFNVYKETSGLVSDWKVPLVESNRCLIRIEQLDNSSEFKEVAWSKNYGGGEYEEISSIIQTNDENYIFVGKTYSYDDSLNDGKGNGDFYLSELDEDGNELWFKRIGGSDVDFAFSITQNFDDNFVIAGISRSTDVDFNTSSSLGSAAVVKIDRNGEIIWANTYGGLYNEVAYSIEKTYDNGNVVAGSSESSVGDVPNNYGFKDGWIFKLDEAGYIRWSYAYGGTGNDELNSITPTLDGGYIAAGYTASNNYDIPKNNGKTDFWILKISATGVKEWSRNYGGSNDERAYDIVQSIDGSYYATGYSYSQDQDVENNKGYYDLWVLKLSTDGDIIWSKTFGGGGYDEGRSLSLTDDGGVIVTGANQSSDGDITKNHGSKDIWVIKLSESGQLEWSRSLENETEEVGNTIVSSVDGSFVIGGYHLNSEGKNKQAKAVKINPPLNSVQLDISDKLFTILMPNLLVQRNNVDMGETIIGQTNDGIVSGVICNDGNAPLHVLGVDITGGDIEDFLIPRGAGDFFLQKDDCQDIMFEFTPTALGTRTAEITVRTTIGNFENTISISGVGVNPIIEPMTEVVDFGKHHLGTSKDTTVIIIENKSNKDVNISSTKLIGPDMEQFEILTPENVSTIGANDIKEIKLRYVAQYPGRTSSRIEFEFEGSISPIRIMLFAEGGGYVVENLIDTVDFGEVKIGTSKDLVVHLVKNLTESTVDISDMKVIGPDMSQFSIQESGTDFKIDGYDSLSIKLRFEANKPGKTSTTIQSYNFFSRTKLETVLLGNVVGGAIEPKMEDAYIGDNLNLELHVVGINPSLLSNIATKFTATISYNPTILALMDKSLSISTVGNESFVNITRLLSGVSQIASIPMKVGLGNTDKSELVVTEFQLYDANGDSVDYDLEPLVGEFSVLGICDEGGKRLLNPNGETTLLKVLPNRTSGQTTVEMTVIENGQTELNIFDQIGNRIETVYSGFPEFGTREIMLDLSNYANGRYYIKLTTPTITKTEILEVVR